LFKLKLDELSTTGFLQNIGYAKSFINAF